jgi:L-lactate dehydrogenase complex protein LldF
MNHALKAKEFLNNASFASWQDNALWFVRQKRDNATKELKEWESLREQADNIKAHTLSNLDIYLEEFEKNALSNGLKVYWAKDALEHNQIVYKILKKNSVKKVVKSKSMLTEECHLNPFLENEGIEVVDTDLGERIIQLRGEKPSHIVLPAIHLKKEQVAKTFEKFLHTKKGNSDPTYLTKAARVHLREKFLNADASITGVNFAVSESGSFVVCTNEGNADMGTSLTKLHIACMGIEKIIPKVEHLGVFIRMLARSATGQSITTYTSHYTKPAKDTQIHIVIVDNGRSKILSQKDFVKSLQCIRCGACMNTCPIYRRSGGHSYSYTIPGPIGSLLGSNRDLKYNGDSAFASTLCGSCVDICPVKIDITHQLLSYRKDFVKQGYLSSSKKYALKVATFVFLYPILTKLVFKTAKFLIPLIPGKILYSKYNVWGRGREMPTLAKKSFSDIYKKMKK